MREFDLHTGPRGLTLRVCAWGPETGRPVVVLHGFLEQGAAWDAFATALGGRVVAPDHRGHGLSQHVGAGGFYHFWDYAGDVDALLRQLPGPIDLVGHSMGGTLATLVAGARPQSVRRLVLVEGLGPPDMTDSARERAIAFLDNLADPKRHPTFADVDEAAARLHRTAPRMPASEALRLARRVTRPVVPDDPHADDDTPGRLTWRWDPLHRSRAPVPFQTSLHLGWLRAITAPTLLVDGGQSPYALFDVSERAAALRDVRTARLPQAGHLLHHDDPEGLAALVRAHLEA